MSCDIFLVSCQLVQNRSIAVLLCFQILDAHLHQTVKTGSVLQYNILMTSSTTLCVIVVLSIREMRLYKPTGASRRLYSILCREKQLAMSKDTRMTHYAHMCSVVCHG